MKLDDFYLVDAMSGSFIAETDPHGVMRNLGETLVDVVERGEPSLSPTAS